MTRQEATEFYRSHSKAVYNTALRIVRDPEEAEEIMQDTFMKYFTKGVPGLSEARKAAWLRTTCIRMGIDFLRRRKKGLELFVERIPDEAEEEEELPESIDVMRIRTAMERLPHPYSLILDLILIEGMDYAGIARLTGQKEATLRSWYSRGRAKLIKDVNAILTPEDKKFLLSFERAEPDWDKFEFAYFQNYPSVKWKLQNLENLKAHNPSKLLEEAEELAKIGHTLA